MASRLEVVSHNVKKIGMTEIVIVQDQETGVLYAYGETGRSDGGSWFTPLLESDGTPVVKTPNHNEY